MLSDDGPGAVVYRTLALHPGWDAAAVATALGKDVREVESVLTRLVALGLVRDDDHSVVTPEAALEGLLQRQAHAQAQWSGELSSIADDVTAVVAGLHSLWPRVRGGASEEVLEGNEAVRRELGAIGRGVRQSLAALHPGQVPAEAVEAAIRDDLAVLSRGVVMQSVFLTSASRRPAVAGYLDRLTDAGAQIRVRHALPFRLILADDTVAVCSMRWAEGRSGAVIVRSAAMLNLLRRSFETFWLDAAPWQGPASTLTAEDGPLTPEQLTMIRMLAEGATDQAIARHLGIAPRTCTRRLRELYDALGVGTRFQAGVEAQRRGLC